MKTVIFSSKEAEIKDVLLLSTSFDIKLFTEKVYFAENEADADLVIVIDKDVYDVLPANLITAITTRIRKTPCLVLVHFRMASEQSEPYKELGLSLFHYEKGSPVSQENLITQIESLAERTTLYRRLDSYIRDSFRDIVDSSLLQKQKEEIELLNRKLEYISRVDHLTNLLNRRALLEAFELEKRRALRNRWRLKQVGGFGDPDEGKSVSEELREFSHASKGTITEHIGNFACMIMDIDHFKLVNDSYGHLIGDKVLHHMGKLLNQKGLFRDCDVKGRYGGEEFIVLLSETNSANALIPAERLRKLLKETTFEGEAGQKFNVSLSIGIAEFLPEEVTSEEMIKRADQALYYAKEHGRDQICIYERVKGQLSALEHGH